ncbi:MAG: glycosyltransferase family 39 protein [Crocosphaera sp.]
MNKKMKNFRSITQSKLQILVTFLVCLSLVVGIFFRFYHLDYKFYSYDETHTSLRVSGYYSREMFGEIRKGNTVLTVDDFQKYQRPNVDKGASQIISGLSKEDPHQSPIYFILARFWVQTFNGFLNEVAATRAFSAFLSLFALLAMYLLCQELFNSQKVSLIAVSLMAISPFHVLYSQYARPYSLFTMMVLLSSLCLLRAIRKKTLSSWFLYTITSLFGFYTQILMSLVLVSHFLFVVCLEKFRLTKTLWYFVQSGLVMFVAAFIWLSGAISINSERGAIGSFKLFRLSEVIRLHLLRIARLFVDTHNLGGIVRFESNSLLTNIARISLMIFLLIIIIYSLLYLIQKSTRREWIFILSLMAVTGLLLGGIVRLMPNQMETRYYVPVYLGIEISLAYLLGQKINKQFNLFSGIFIFLISLGIISGIISSQTKVWWVNLPSSIIQAPQVVETINKVENPIIVWNDYKSNGNWNTHILLGLSYKFNPNTGFMYLNKKLNLDKALEDSNSVFLYRPHPEIQEKLSKRYDMIPAYQEERGAWLWRVTLPKNQS